MPRDLQVAFGLPSPLLHPSPLPPSHTPSSLHLPASRTAGRPRPRSRDTLVRAAAPPALRSAGSRTRREGAPAPTPDSSHWPSRLPVPALLFPSAPPSWSGCGAGTSGLGGAAARGRGRVEEEAGQAGRRLTGTNHGQPGQEGGGVRQRHWGKARRGGRVCVCGVRAGPLAATLGCGGAGRRAGGLSGGAGQPGAGLPALHPKAAKPVPARSRASARVPRDGSRR